MKVLKVIKGLNQGKNFSLKDGLILGSSKGNIILGEESTEEILARVEMNLGDTFLKSEGSSANIFCDGELVSHIVLKPGVQFRLGATHFEVQEVAGEYTEEYLLDGTAEVNLAEINMSSDSEESEKEKKEREEKEKEDLIKEILGGDLESEEENKEKEEDERTIAELEGVQIVSVKEELRRDMLSNELWKVENEGKEMQFLKQPIYLKFEKGLQKGLCWEITYLPRKIGSLDADLPLIYHQFQNVNFYLNLKDDKIIFSTDQPDLFLVNYKQTEQAELKNKDLIIIGASYIRFSTENTNKP